jgi:pyruvate kinase
MPRHTFTKIVSTIGPASKPILKKMLENNLDVCRLNFSHGTYEEHADTIKTIREISKNSQRPIGIIADLQGPKFRIGSFKDGSINLKTGQEFTVYLEDKLGDNNGVSLPNKEVYEVLTVGQKILLDDGYVALEVTKAGRDFAKTKVLYGERLSDHKGFNVPHTILDIPILTPKDKKDLEFALSQDVDYIAISFVQTAKDVMDVKKLIKGKAKIISKIEKPSAVEDLENIVKESDAIMVARGDLAVEMSIAAVPAVQRDMIAMCQKYGKPVIVATQMMESMICSPAPTRAEASDVATAVYLGADAVMTSAETAVGQYPFETIETMANIISATEKSKNWSSHLNESARSKDVSTMKEAVALSVANMAEFVNASAIVCLSVTGMLAKTISSYRHHTQILSLSRNEKLANESQLFWGIHPKLIEEKEDPTISTSKHFVTKYAKKIMDLKKDDVVVITSGQRSSDKTSIMQEGLSDTVTVLKL